MAIRIHAHINVLQKDKYEPNPGKGYVLKFYDKDAMVDDELGQVVLDETGEVNLEIERKMFDKTVLLNDYYPDVYFKVFRENKEIYRSDVYKNIHWKINTKNDGKSVFVYELGNVFL